MALSKFPVEVPLGGAVNEGDVPVVVQPPRIREAKDCASIKGGAYQKKDAQTVGQAVNPQTLAIEHTRDATTTFQTTTIEVYPDDGSSNTESYPSPVTGRELRRYSPTESDAVKQHGDHATLQLPTGEQRTLAAWNVDPVGGYQIAQGVTEDFSGNPPPTAPASMWANSISYSSSYYRIDGARYAIFDGDVQKGSERSYEPLTAAESASFAPASALLEGAPVGFPRVRADSTTGPDLYFWSCAAIAYPARSPALPDQWGFTLSARTPAARASDNRTVLNAQPNASNENGASPVTPGCKIYVHSADGTQLAACVHENGSAGTGPQLTPPLDMIFVDGEGLYTLHAEVFAAAPTEVTIRKWIFDAGLGQIVADASITVSPPTGAGAASWPAGIHDLDDRLMLVWNNTARYTYDYDLTGSITLYPPFVAGLFLGEQYIQGEQIGPPGVGSVPDRFARLCEFNYDTNPTFLFTSNMTRGAWTGSFAAPVGDGSGQWWCGVQLLSSDQLNPVTAGYEPYARIFSGSMIHALLDANGALIDATSGGPSVGIMPGVAIASHGSFMAGVGPVVGVYASAPGDDRTALAQNCPPAFADVPTSTYLLIARREIPELADVGQLPYNFGADDMSAQNQAVAVAQLQPQSAALGTYQINPFQVRTNLFARDDDAMSLMLFERSAPSNFDTDELNDTLWQSELRSSGAASRARPYIAQIAASAAMGTVAAGDYAVVDGALPVASGGPQAPAAGWGPQAIIDRPIVNIDTNLSGPGNMPLPASVEPSNGATVGQFFSCAGHAVIYDESGGQHRTVPHSTAAAYAMFLGGDPASTLPSDPCAQVEVQAYPMPYPLLGLANSQTALIEVYFSEPEERGGPIQVGQLTMYPLGFAVWQSDEVSSPGRPPVLGAPRRILPTIGGSDELLYTAAGELAADAPDPSAALAAANNRIWSVSSINPRQAQYSKLLRRGYAPEWNGNLTVRVPGSEDPLTAVGVLPDGRVLLFSQSAIYYTYGEGPSDTGQGAGFAEPALLTDTVGCENKRSVVFGDFGCMFQGARGFYLVDRGLTLTYVGLPYEDSTAGPVLATAIDGLRSEVIFYSGVVEGGNQQRWIFNYLRQQWSTFGQTELGFAATQREGRPVLAEVVGGGVQLVALSEQPAAASTIPFDSGLMAIRTGWLAMGRIQGFGRVWELQIEGQQQLASASGLRVELSYDYQDAPSETFDYDAPAAAGGRIKIRIRPRRQKCESISVRVSEYVPSTAIPEVCTGWQVEMLTLLCGVKVGLDKVATTEAST